MSRPVQVTGPAGTRAFAPEDLPVRIGLGGRADIRVPGPVTGEILALVSLLDDRLLLQRSGAGAAVAVNGEPLAATRWLADGDVITLDSLRIECRLQADAFVLAVAYADLGHATLPPEAPVAEPAPVPRGPAPPAASGARPALPPRGRHLGPGLIYGGLALLAALAFYLFTSHPVRFRVEPAGASVEVASGFFHLRIGGSYLLRTGDYQVVATAPGYRRLESRITVGDAPSQFFDLKLEELPGRLVVRTKPAERFTLRVDGAPVAADAAGDFPVPAGEHLVRVEAERYRPFEQKLTVKGLDQRQEIQATLEPDWAEVQVTSTPDGAVIYVDGQESGTTPAKLELLSGNRQVEIRKEGYKPARRDLTIVAGQPVDLAAIVLEEADGILRILTTPTGAAVTVDGRYRGRSPLDVDVTPGRPHAVTLASPGYDTVTRIASVERRGAQTDLRVDLPARVGVVRVLADPADAELVVDGVSRGAASQELSLPAVSHRIEVRKPGYASFSAEVTPQPGVPRQLDVKLLTPQQAVLAATPKTLTTRQGQALRLIEPGSFTMGTPRREQGRRPNESEHPVRLTRRFYLGTREVTNKDFREFRPGHTSGAEKYQELAAGQHPAVMLAWEDAVAYCNWLSDREGLPRAYVQKDGAWRLAEPATPGFRLPTEAEWEWASRYNGGDGEQRFPWGAQMPPAPKSGNYADRSAKGFVPDIMADYDDGFPVTAPVGSFPPSALGLYDIGGNVAEWVSDFYTIPPGGVAVTDPVGPDTGQYHVIRGSGWRSSSISDLRLAARDFGDRGRLDVGFRIARYAD